MVRSSHAIKKSRLFSLGDSWMDENGSFALLLLLNGDTIFSHCFENRNGATTAVTYNDAVVASMNPTQSVLPGIIPTKYLI